MSDFIIYKCQFTESYSDAVHTANILWHFSHLIPTFYFEVNGISFGFNSSEAPHFSVLSEENAFILYLQADRIADIQKDVDFLHYVLPLHEPFLFFPGDESSEVRSKTTDKAS